MAWQNAICARWPVSQRLTIVGHASPTPGHAAAAAQRWGGRAYSSHAELLKNEEVDAAWVSVPPDAHGDIEFTLIDHGIPFLVEKPLGTDLVIAQGIAVAVAQRSLIVGVGYHLRAMDLLDEVKATLAQNPARMVIGTWHDATPPPQWWRKQARSGGQMVEQATHLFDLARLLVGEATVLAATADHVERPAYPDADVAAVSTALLRFQSGASGVFTATCLLGGAAAVHLQLVCDGLLITITRNSVIYERGSEQREVRLRHDPVKTENMAFLRAVQQQDAGLLYSSYADALKTHRLCLEVNRRAKLSSRRVGR